MAYRGLGWRSSKMQTVGLTANRTKRPCTEFNMPSEKIGVTTTGCSYQRAEAREGEGKFLRAVTESSQPHYGARFRLTPRTARVSRGGRLGRKSAAHVSPGWADGLGESSGRQPGLTQNRDSATGRRGAPCRQADARAYGFGKRHPRPVG